MSTKILWNCPTDWVKQDSTLQINYPSVEHPAAEITTTVPGDSKWVFVALRLSDYSLIKAVRVCYQLSSSSSFISQVRLIETQTPGLAVIRYNDATDLLSTVPACHVSEVGLYRMEGAVTLALRLKFADTTDKISLGPVGLDVETCGIDVTDVKCFGAVGDGEANDTGPIQKAIDAVETAGGGTVYFPVGTYLTNKPLKVISDGITFLGAGRDTTVVQNSSSNLLHVSSAEIFVRNFVLEHIQLKSLRGGGHVIVVPKGMGQSTIRAARLVQRNDNRSIYRLRIDTENEPTDESARGGYNNLVTETWLQGPTNPTVPQWYVAVNGSFYNSNTFERLRCDNSGDFFYHLEASEATLSGNSFRDITFENCSGGKIRLLSCANTLMQECVSYDDLHSQVTNDGFYVGRSPHNNSLSAYTTFINCDRRSGSLNGRFKDIRLIPDECLATTVISFGGRKGAGIAHDFGNTPVVAIGMSYSVTFGGTGQTTRIPMP